MLKRVYTYTITNRTLFVCIPLPSFQRRTCMATPYSESAGHQTAMRWLRTTGGLANQWWRLLVGPGPRFTSVSILQALASSNGEAADSGWDLGWTAPSRYRHGLAEANAKERSCTAAAKAGSVQAAQSRCRHLLPGLAPAPANCCKRILVTTSYMLLIAACSIKQKQ